MTIHRRRFLGFAALGTAAGWLGGCERLSHPEALADASEGPDAAVSAADAALDGGATCRTTTNDALGPFHQAGAPHRADLADETEPGDSLELVGTVVSEDCITPVAGALLDIWQADASGMYHGGASDQFRLRGQVLTNKSGGFYIRTIRPGNYQLGGGLWRPAHLHFIITHPQFSTVTTQVYFAGDPYLPPNDGCTSCGSDDPDRIIQLDSVKGGPSQIGTVRFVLRRS